MYQVTRFLPTPHDDGTTVGLGLGECGDAWVPRCGDPGSFIVGQAAEFEASAAPGLNQPDDSRRIVDIAFTTESAIARGIEITHSRT